MTKYLYTINIVMMLMLILGCGGGASTPINPPVDEPIVVAVEFRGPHAAQAVRALQRAAQNDTTISLGVDLRNADDRNGYVVRERSDEYITDDGYITITGLYPGPMCMWLNGDFTSYHWSGACELKPGANVVYLSTYEYEEYTAYETLNRVFDTDHAPLFAAVSYPRFEAICREEGNPAEAYERFLQEAGIEAEQPDVRFVFRGEPYTANNSDCHNQSSNYEEGDYVEHVAKYDKDGEECSVELEWQVRDEDGFLVDSGCSQEDVPEGEERYGYHTDPSNADYPSGDYTVDYDAVATDEDGNIVDETGGTTSLRIRLPLND
ncbi:MAG: hypothetical protein V1807_01510 [Patescibacteria group bacterium]